MTTGSINSAGGSDENLWGLEGRLMSKNDKRVGVYSDAVLQGLVPKSNGMIVNALPAELSERDQIRQLRILIAAMILSNGGLRISVHTLMEMPADVEIVSVESPDGRWITLDLAPAVKS
jgi:hypothetical protein